MFKVGDKVRIIKASAIEGCEAKDGDILDVINVDFEDCPVLKDVDGEGLCLLVKELKYIEKVAEQVAKFKVGDKVRAISSEYLFTNKKNGWTGIVTHVYETGGFRAKSLTLLNEDGFEYGGLDQNHFELISPKPTKNQRISTLEKEVEALKSEVAALKLGGTITHKLTVTTKDKSPNEQRKAIISEAKEFIVEYENAANGFMAVHEGNGLLSKYGMIVKYEINASKRAVVSLLYHDSSGKLVGKAITKCAPNDVFNADIGKAIALGRALGLDVKRFEQAVQPTEVVVGQVVKDTDKVMSLGNGKVTKIEPVGTLYSRGYCTDNAYAYLHQAKILDDTEAKY